MSISAGVARLWGSGDIGCDWWIGPGWLDTDSRRARDG